MRCGEALATLLAAWSTVKRPRQPPESRAKENTKTFYAVKVNAARDSLLIFKHYCVAQLFDQKICC